jgi:L-asparaginase
VHLKSILLGNWVKKLKVNKVLDKNVVTGINEAVLEAIVNIPNLKGIVLGTYGA